jgi:hypothetical protein
VKEHRLGACEGCGIQRRGSCLRLSFQTFSGISSGITIKFACYLTALCEVTLLGHLSFGSLLLWQTRFIEVWYRYFVLDFKKGENYLPNKKDAGKPMKVVLDGQQRLQSLYVGICGSSEGKRLNFNVTGGPGFKDEEIEQPADTYRFEFW